MPTAPGANLARRRPGADPGGTRTPDPVSVVEIRWGATLAPRPRSPPWPARLDSSPSLPPRRRVDDPRREQARRRPRRARRVVVHARGVGDARRRGESEGRGRREGAREQARLAGGERRGPADARPRQGDTRAWPRAAAGA